MTKSMSSEERGFDSVPDQAWRYRRLPFARGIVAIAVLFQSFGALLIFSRTGYTAFTGGEGSGLMLIITLTYTVNCTLEAAFEIGGFSLRRSHKESVARAANLIVLLIFLFPLAIEDVSQNLGLREVCRMLVTEITNGLNLILILLVSTVLIRMAQGRVL